jgi:hypothetical protein
MVVLLAPTGEPHLPPVDIAPGATSAVLGDQPEESPEVGTDAPSPRE